MILPAPTIVFDLDGTLVDTAPDLVAAANHVLAREGLAAVPLHRLRRHVGKGARRILELAFAEHALSLEAAALDRHVATFLDHYSENLAVASRPFPGAVEALEALRLAGARLAVCTNKRERFAVELLDALNLSRLFAAIAGGDTFSVQKPDPAHLLGVIARAGGTEEHAVMVGDSDIDVIVARAARIPIVGVSFGYSDVAIETLGPDAVIDHFHQLFTTLDALRRSLREPVERV